MSSLFPSSLASPFPVHVSRQQGCGSAMCLEQNAATGNAEVGHAVPIGRYAATLVLKPRMNGWTPRSATRWAKFAACVTPHTQPTHNHLITGWSTVEGQALQPRRISSPGRSCTPLARCQAIHRYPRLHRTQRQVSLYAALRPHNVCRPCRKRTWQVLNTAHAAGASQAVEAHLRSNEIRLVVHYVGWPANSGITYITARREAHKEWTTWFNDDGDRHQWVVSEQRANGINEHLRVFRKSFLAALVTVCMIVASHSRLVGAAYLCTKLRKCGDMRYRAWQVGT